MYQGVSHWDAIPVNKRLKPLQAVDDHRVNNVDCTAGGIVPNGKTMQNLHGSFTFCNKKTGSNEGTGGVKNGRHSQRII